MRMTRVNIALEAGVALVMYAIGHHLGGEILSLIHILLDTLEYAQVNRNNRPLIESLIDKMCIRDRS